MRLCYDVHVPIITVVDNKARATKMHTFDRARDKGRPILNLGKWASLGVDT